MKNLIEFIKSIPTKLKREPDIKIGHNYLHRWYVIPRNPVFNIYLHKFIRSDDDRALHDHPWVSLSFLLKGEILEHTLNKKRVVYRFWPVLRPAKLFHRLEVLKGPVYTLFITGPRMRSWGFLCPNGWRHWTQFTDSTGKSTGPGCE